MQRQLAGVAAIVSKENSVKTVTFKDDKNLKMKMFNAEEEIFNTKEDRTFNAN